MNKLNLPPSFSSSRAFVLRCWHDKDTREDAALTWRFMLEEIGSERRRWGFASFKQLTNHLQDELEVDL